MGIRNNLIIAYKTHLQFCSHDPYMCWRVAQRNGGSYKEAVSSSRDSRKWRLSELKQQLLWLPTVPRPGMRAERAAYWTFPECNIWSQKWRSPLFPITERSHNFWFLVPWPGQRPEAKENIVATRKLPDVSPDAFSVPTLSFSLHY